MPHYDPPKLSRVIFGSMAYSGSRAAQRIRVIHCAIDHGITSIDTAPLYEAGEAERIVGRAIADRRDAVQILTKCGLRWDSDFGNPMFEMMVDGQLRVVRKDSRPRAINEEIEQSLQRLGTDVIDLIQVHQLDDQTPLDDTLNALEAARKAGKVRAVGVSNYPLPQLEAAHALLPDGLFSTQNQFNMIEQVSVAEIRAFARSAEIAFLAYSPLAQGVLAGKYLHDTSKSQDWRMNTAYLRPRNLRRINTVLEQSAVPLARNHGVGVAQVCLAWTLAQLGVSAVIAGATTEQQCRENAAAMHLQLPAPALDELGDAMTRCGFRSADTPVDRIRERARRFKQFVGRRIRRGRSP